MSTTLFPFRFTQRPAAREFPVFATRVVGANEGIDQRAADFGDDFKLRVIGSLRLPQASTSKTLDDWLAFVEEHLGAYDSFLYAAILQRYRVVTDDAIGTGDGTTTVFALRHKYLDSSTLAVEKDGVLQTGGGTHYTFSGNNTAPIVTFGTAPANGLAITASYEFRWPMRLLADGHEPVILTGKPTDALRNVRIDEIVLEAASAGGHLV